MGVFGIHNLLFFADAYPTQFRRMCPETDGGYPFAIAGLNISMMLLAMLDVTGRKTCFTTTHAQNTTQAKKSRYAFVELMLRSTNGMAVANAGLMHHVNSVGAHTTSIVWDAAAALGARLLQLWQGVW